MASMHPSSERRMLMRYSEPRNDPAMASHMAVSMFMLVLMVLLVIGAAYYYASYRLESQQYNMLLPIARAS
jgi:hypothetical protein